MLQCVLQCVAACSSVSPCVAACCSVSLYTATGLHCNTHFITLLELHTCKLTLCCKVCCRKLQCVPAHLNTHCVDVGKRKREWTLWERERATAWGHREAVCVCVYKSLSHGALSLSLSLSPSLPRSLASSLALSFSLYLCVRKARSKYLAKKESV